MTLEGVLSALYDGMRLATLLVCFGAANVLANPRRLIKAAPAALQDVGVAVTVAVSLAPQLIDSARRVGRARRLRSGAGNGVHFVRQVVIPVLTDALDRSLALAAAMDSRGHGRVDAGPTRSRRVSGALVLVGLCLVCVGTYLLLDTTTARTFGAPALVCGVVSSRLGVADFRPACIHHGVPLPALARAGVGCRGWCGVAVAMGWFAFAHLDADNLNPSTQPLHWPALPLAASLFVLFGALPAWLAPPRDERAEGVVRALRHDEPVGASA